MFDQIPLLSLAAVEAAPRDSITSIPLLTYAWVVLISVAGGVANFYRKMREGAARPFNLNEFIGECAISGFVGVITFWICKAGGVNEFLTAAAVGITGHMGSRAIFALEKFLERWLAARSPTQMILPADASPK